MNLSEKEDYLPIVLGHKQKASRMAFDGCSYYFTVMNQCKIVKSKAKPHVERYYDTCREYDRICYDGSENCFWTTAKNCNNIIFKLDCHMNEIDAIQLCGCYEIGGVITGITYNPCDDKILVTFYCALLQVDKHDGSTIILYRCIDNFITGVVSVSPNYIVTIFKEDRQYVDVLNDDGVVLKSIEFDCELMIRSIVLNPCPNQRDVYFVEYLIYKKGWYPYLVKQLVNEYDLGYNPCDCNYKICQEYCDDEPDDNCTGIIKSIALIETALSHILYAESEKLKKILATTDDIDKILRINKEVNRTVMNVTHLEYELYAKLQILQDTCQDENLCNSL